MTEQDGTRRGETHGTDMRTKTVKLKGEGETELNIKGLITYETQVSSKKRVGKKTKQEVDRKNMTDEDIIY